MSIIDLEFHRYSFDDYPYTDISSGVRIEFKTATRMRNFINTSCRIFGNKGNIYRILKIKKMRHTTMQVLLEKMTLREYNLDVLIDERDRKLNQILN